MTVRCHVNQGECLRRGIDAPRSKVLLTLYVETTTQDVRDMLADRMKPGRINVYKYGTDEPLWIPMPSVAGLLEALQADVERVRKETA